MAKPFLRAGQVVDLEQLRPRVRRAAGPVIDPAGSLQRRGELLEPGNRMTATRVAQGKIGGIPEDESYWPSRNAHLRLLGHGAAAALTARQR